MASSSPLITPPRPPPRRAAITWRTSPPLQQRFGPGRVGRPIRNRIARKHSSTVEHDVRLRVIAHDVRFHISIHPRVAPGQRRRRGLSCGTAVHTAVVPVCTVVLRHARFTVHQKAKRARNK